MCTCYARCAALFAVSAGTRVRVHVCEMVEWNRNYIRTAAVIPSRWNADSPNYRTRRNFTTATHVFHTSLTTAVDAGLPQVLYNLYGIYYYTYDDKEHSQCVLQATTQQTLLQLFAEYISYAGAVSIKSEASSKRSLTTTATDTTSTFRHVQTETRLGDNTVDV